MRTNPELWIDVLRVGKEKLPLAILSLPTNHVGTPLFLLPTKELGRQQITWLLDNKYLFPEEAQVFQEIINTSPLPESSPDLHMTERYEEELWGLDTKHAAYPN